MGSAIPTGSVAMTSTSPSSRASSESCAAALAAFRRAVSVAPRYRGWLAERGIAPERVSDISEVPYLTKQDVFAGGLEGWIEGGHPSGAAELLTSSGLSGSFSVGVSSRSELLAQQAGTDAALRSIGAGEDTTTLLLNCLPMGITVPTTLATVATPSVHLEMAQEVMERLGPDFDRVVILGEPVFLKELAERLFAAHGAGWSASDTTCIVGGEWVSESWRRYVGGLLGMPAPEQQGPGGILISMGAAELGLNLLYETPQLRAVRSLLDQSGQTRDLFAHQHDYTPSLFSYDPTRIHLEQRHHEDGSRTLVFTPLGRRLLPLVRYDLGDLGEIIPAARINAFLEGMGSLVTAHDPLVAVWGRRTLPYGGAAEVVRPEQIKQRLFAFTAEAAVLTGRFRLERAGEGWVLHVQQRQRTVPTPDLEDALGNFLSRLVGGSAHAIVHPHGEYPFHTAGDFQHKPVYAP